MNWFEILVGISSVGSFIVAVIALFKVRKVEKAISISKEDLSKTKQSINRSKFENVSGTQVGRDYKGD